MSRSVLRLPIYFGFLLFSMTGLRLAAQTNFGRISVTVSDTSGAIVSGVRVIITSADTQAVRPVTTDAHGFYVAENLPVGPYRLRRAARIQARRTARPNLSCDPEGPEAVSSEHGAL